MITHELPEPRPPARVVVLGATGFIGSAVSRELVRSGVPVLALGSRDLDLTASDAGDRLAAMLRGDDAVVMISALTPDKGKTLGVMIRNLAMAGALADALGRGEVAHVIYVSSDAVYPAVDGPITESTPAAPRELPGAMHVAREIAIGEAAKGRYLVVRPTAVYGSGDTHNAYGPNRFRRSAAEAGSIKLIGEGEERRDHIHVDDVARILARALERRSRGVLNAATGACWSFRDVAERVAARAGRPVEIIGSTRAAPIAHPVRAFDTRALRAAFPELRLRSIDEGLALDPCH